MSDSLNSQMYGGDDPDAIAQPSLVSKTKVSLSGFGKIQSMDIEGQKVLLVDPSWIENLERKLEQTSQTCLDLHNRLVRANTTLSALKAKVEVLTNKLDRITSDN